jgi:hypothetical protein
MKIHRELQQKTWPWFEARAGKISGSELGNLITDKGKIRDWKTGMPNSYLHRKLAEKWRGAPMETFTGSRQTDQGNILEPQARNYFAALLESDITEIGGMESDDGRLWCSPDGIIGETVGLEIKCPNADTHVGWLLDGPHVPEEHVLQVQFALFVTGWPTWRFLSYVKDMPHLAVNVTPDDELQETIMEAVACFKAKFDADWDRLCELNGGPPPPRPKVEMTTGPIRFSWEQGAGYGDPNDVPTP